MKRLSRSARRVAIIGCGLALCAGGLSGCINQAEYDRLYEAYNSCQARNADLERERNEARAAADQLRSGIGRGEGTMADLQKQNADLRAQLDKSLADYRAMGDRIGQLSFGPLDAETSQRLDELAAKYPNLLTYDATRGLLRVASDLTFDSGSAVVKDDAKQALSALSEVLKSGAAMQYQIVVEGHTDSQAISRNDTLKFHPTNRHLSVHRSISVIDVLGAMGVPQDRMMAAGWGEYRPATPNTPTGNTPANRRVEIFLAKLKSVNTTTTPTTTTPKVTTNPDDVTK